LEEYKCEVCNKSIPDEEGITETRQKEPPIMLDKFATRIEKTGELYNGDFLFTHLVLTEGEWEKIKASTDREKFPFGLKVDFVSVLRDGGVEYIHVTDADRNYIEQNGLKEGRYVGDLGRGIYVVEESNPEAVANLMDFLSEYKEEEELILVKGYYKGPYTECVYGYGHEGYIVLKGTDGVKPGEISIDRINVEEFEIRYCPESL